MQQLTLSPENVRICDDVLLLDCFAQMQAMGFVAFCQCLCQQLQAKRLEMEAGADREQCHFSLDHQRWVICAEQLCEAIWIEPLGRGDLNLLRKRLVGLS